MQSSLSSMLFLILIIVLMFAMTWWSSKKTKQRQQSLESFRTSLKPGQEVSTASGLLGTVVSIDLEKEQVVIDSEGTKSRWRIQAITEPPIVPAYVHDDEVDEQGNPKQVSSDSETPSSNDSVKINDSAVDSEDSTPAKK